MDLSSVLCYVVKYLNFLDLLHVEQTCRSIRTTMAANSIWLTLCDRLEIVMDRNLLSLRRFLIDHFKCVNLLKHIVVDPKNPLW